MSKNMMSRAASLNALPQTGRRRLLQAGMAGLAGGWLPAASFAKASGEPYRVGLMLPATGTFAVVGDAVANGFRLAIEEYGGQLGGRPVQIVTLDDESDPAKATDNTNRLVRRDKVDVIVGTVHSGVTMAMAKVARDTGTLLVIPNAGADALTRQLCAPNIFRTSFSNWQPAYAAGKLSAQQGHRNVVTLAWKYAAGEESVRGFKEGYADAGTVVKELYLPFPNVEFQAYLAEIGGLKPDAVYAFTPGSAAVKLVKDYAAAGLTQRIPLFGPGFMTDGLLEAMGDSAEGMLTTLHYADGLDTPRDNAFRSAYQAAYGGQVPDVFAVQGYDAAQLLQAGLTAVNGDTGNKEALIRALEAARIDSPRGSFTLSSAHNPVQDIYVRRVAGGRNVYEGIAVKALADPGTGCRL